jgi:hypothetical protein
MISPLTLPSSRLSSSTVQHNMHRHSLTHSLSHCHSQLSFNDTTLHHTASLFNSSLLSSSPRHSSSLASPLHDMPSSSSSSSAAVKFQVSTECFDRQGGKRKCKYCDATYKAITGLDSLRYHMWTSHRTLAKDMGCPPLQLSELKSLRLPRRPPPPPHPSNPHSPSFLLTMLMSEYPNLTSLSQIRV